MANGQIHVAVFLIAAAVLSRAVLFGADDMRGERGTQHRKVEVKSRPGAGGPNTQKIEATDNGYKFVTDGVNAQGQKTHDELPSRLTGKDARTNPMVDGKPHPMGRAQCRRGRSMTLQSS